jgi:hypothetical protein
LWPGHSMLNPDSWWLWSKPKLIINSLTQQNRYQNGLRFARIDGQLISNRPSYGFIPNPDSNKVSCRLFNSLGSLIMHSWTSSAYKWKRHMVNSMTKSLMNIKSKSKPKVFREFWAKELVVDTVEGLGKPTLRPVSYPVVVCSESELTITKKTDVDKLRGKKAWLKSAH